MPYRPEDCRVYVGNLPHSTRTRDVDDLFRRIGPIANINLKKSPYSNGTPFAFVEFEEPNDADNAVKERNGYLLDGSRIRVEFPRGKPWKIVRDFRDVRRRGVPPTRTKYRIIVYGLPEGGSWQDLKDHFRVAGDVSFADIRSNGDGIVEFAREEAMLYAVKRMDESRFKGHRGDTTTIRIKKDNSSSLERERVYRSRSRSRSRGGHDRNSPLDSRKRRREYSRSPSPYQKYSRHEVHSDVRKERVRSRSFTPSQRDRSLPAETKKYERSRHRERSHRSASPCPSASPNRHESSYSPVSNTTHSGSRSRSTSQSPQNDNRSVRQKRSE